MAGTWLIILLTMHRQCRAGCQPLSSCNQQDRLTEEPRRKLGSGCISVLSCHDVHAFKNSSSTKEGEPCALSPLPSFTAVEPGNLLLPSQT